MLEIFLFASSSILLSVVEGIDLQSAHTNGFSLPCFVPKNIVPVDMTWVKSVRTWYYPHMSVLDLYLNAVEISGKPAQELSEDELYNNACITYEMGAEIDFQGPVIMRGFGDQQRTLEFMPINVGLDEYRWRINRPGSTHGGLTYTTLTDNTTFLMQTTCQQERMTWGVIAVLPRMPPDTVARIHENALSNGFRKEDFTGLNYDSCFHGSQAPFAKTQVSGLIVGHGAGDGTIEINMQQERPQTLQQSLNQWITGWFGRGWGSLFL